MAEDTQGSGGWATVAALLSALGSAYSADQMAGGQRDAIGSTNALAGRSRQDAINLFGQGGESGRQGLMAAMDFYGDGARERMMPMTLGNVAAQGVAQQGGIQANNAIMGLPVDMGYASPQQINALGIPSASGMVQGGLSAETTPSQPNTQVPYSPSPAPAPITSGSMGGLMGTVGAELTQNNRPDTTGRPPRPESQNGEEEGGGLMGRIGNWVSDNWDDALGAAAGFAYGGPVGAQLGARGANWLRNTIQGTPSVSMVEAAPGEELPPAQTTDRQAPVGVAQPIEWEDGDPVQTATETEQQAAPTVPNDQWERASNLASGGLQREAQNQEMMQSNLEATLGAGSRGQNVGNAYSASANSAASAAGDWLRNQYSFDANDPYYGAMVNYLVPWLMEQVSAGMSYRDALNTVSPSEIQRRIAAAKQAGA